MVHFVHRFYDYQHLVQFHLKDAGKECAPQIRWKFGFSQNVSSLRSKTQYCKSF